MDQRRESADGGLAGRLCGVAAVVTMLAVASTARPAVAEVSMAAWMQHSADDMSGFASFGGTGALENVTLPFAFVIEGTPYTTLTLSTDGGLGGTSPLTEDARFNLTSRFPYHEGVLAVTADNVWYSSLQTSAHFGGERMDASRTIRWARENGAVGAAQVAGASPSIRSDFSFVGRVPAADVNRMFGGLHPQSSETASYGGHMRFTNEPHRPFNNCHRYVAQLLSQLN